MTRLRYGVLATIAIVCGASYICPAEAESVRVISGPNSFGAGWMFLDTDGCYVVTAGHVVTGTDGRILKVVIRDGRGREWTPAAPVVLSATADIAILPIPNAADPAVCGAPGRSRLRVAGVAERARTLSRAHIERAGLGETMPVAVELVATKADRSRGAVFAVKLMTSSIDVAKGWSGSPITDPQGLIGIVVEADPEDGTASAVRADAIAELFVRAKHGEPSGAPATSVAKTTAATSVSSAKPSKAEGLDIMVLAGETVDPAQGPSEIFSTVGPGWIVRPKVGTVAFDLAARRERSFERVALSVGAPNRIAELEVAVEVASGGEEKTFLPIRSCRVDAKAAGIGCSFLAQTRKSLRITLRVSGSEPLSLEGLDIR